MSLHWNAVHLGERRVDSLIVQLGVNDSEADIGGGKKSGEQLFGLAEALRRPRPAR